MKNRIATACAALIVLSMSGFDAPAANAQSGVWTTNGPEGATVNDLAVDPLVANTVYAGTDAGGVFKSTDAGGSWTAVNNGLPGLRIFAVAVDPQVSTTLYASVAESGVFKSLDGGENWTDVSTGIPPSIRGSIFCLAINPRTPTTLYAATNDGGVFKTIDGGATWNFAPGVTPVTVASLAIDPQTSDTVYAGTDLNVWRSTDGATTWARTALVDATIFALTIDPQGSGTVFAGARTFRPEPGSGIHKSTDGGTSWTWMNVGWPGGRIGRAVVIDSNTRTTIYASALGGGVFQSTDGGARWTERNEGLTNLSVRSLAIDPSAQILYAGTEGGGVFAIDVAQRFSLSVTKTGLGRGTVTSSPDGVHCGATCSASYLSGTTVTLTAVPAFASIFTGWNGCDSTSGSTCTVTVDAARSVTATFFGLPIWFRR